MRPNTTTTSKTVNFDETTTNNNRKPIGIPIERVRKNAERTEKKR